MPVKAIIENKFKRKNNLLNEYHDSDLRLNMCQKKKSSSHQKA